MPVYLNCSEQQLYHHQMQHNCVTKYLLQQEEKYILTGMSNG
jgi:hypothetical protein